MHNLHILIVNADNANEAVKKAKSSINHWGDSNNWSSIGGVAGEDGKDDVECHEDGARWKLSYLQDDNDGTKSNFQLTLNHIKEIASDPVKFNYLKGDQAGIKTLDDAKKFLAAEINNFSVQEDESIRLYAITEAVSLLREVIDYRRIEEDPKNNNQPELFAGTYDKVGLTEFTNCTEGRQKYAVLLDMHS